MLWGRKQSTLISEGLDTPNLPPPQSLNMKKLTGILFLCFALLSLVSCTKDIVDTTGTINGTVVDSRTNEPLQGVTVSISSVGNKVTGTDGTFEFVNIEAQTYTLSLSKPDYQSDTKTVTVRAGETTQVQYSLTPSTSSLSVSQTKLDFGNDVTNLSFDISNPGYAALTWQIAEDCAWFSCSPSSGTVQAGEKTAVVVTVNREGMERGNYSQTLVVSSNGGSATITVNMAVQGISVSVTPSELDFGSVTSSMQLALANNGSAPVSYSITLANDWVSVNKKSGNVTTAENIVVSVDRTGFSEGDYSSSLTVAFGKDEVVVPVRMNVPTKSKPIVNMLDVRDITYSEAKFMGSVVSIGSSKVTQLGFCWSTNEEPTIDTAQYCTLGDTESAKDYDYLASGLEAETTYYVRAYAINVEGTSYSNQMAFTTNGTPKKAEVETGSVSNIQPTQAIVAGNILSIGNVEQIDQFGHVWNTTGNPTVNNSKTELGATSMTGSFNSTLTGLNPNTTYYVRAYATNSVGTSYGEAISFTTIKDAVSVVTNEPTEITHNSAILNGTISSDGGHTIVEVGFYYSQIKDFTIGNATKLTVSGTPSHFSYNLTGLTEQTVYYIKAYAITDTEEVFLGSQVPMTTLNREVTIDKNDYGDDLNWN